MTRLTLDSAKTMPFEDLVSAAKALVDKYNPPSFEDPDQHETEEEFMARLDRGLDEIPAVYGFLLSLHDMFDHWTDFYANQESTKSLTYKSYRQRRDALADMASYAKLRYEGTSRLLTRRLGFIEEARMPRGRG